MTNDTISSTMTTIDIISVVAIDITTITAMIDIVMTTTAIDTTNNNSYNLML